MHEARGDSEPGLEHRRRQVGGAALGRAVDAAALNVVLCVLLFMLQCLQITQLHTDKQMSMQLGSA